MCPENKFSQVLAAAIAAATGFSLLRQRLRKDEVTTMDGVETMSSTDHRWLETASELYDQVTFKSDALFNEPAPGYQVSFIIGGVSGVSFLKLQGVLLDTFGGLCQKPELAVRAQSSDPASFCLVFSGLCNPWGNDVDQTRVSMQKGALQVECTVSRSDRDPCHDLSCD